VSEELFGRGALEDYTLRKQFHFAIQMTEELQLWEIQMEMMVR